MASEVFPTTQGAGRRSSRSFHQARPARWEANQADRTTDRTCKYDTGRLPADGSPAAVTLLRDAAEALAGQDPAGIDECAGVGQRLQ